MTDLNREPGAPPRRRLRAPHIILISVAGLAILGGGLYLILSSTLGPLVQSGDDFMGGLANGQYERAHALTTPALRQQVGDAAGLERSVGAYRPQEWSWSQRSIRNGAGRLEGSVTYRGGRIGTARLNLLQVDGQWRVERFSLN
jgi:hypothetical protein